VWRKAVLDSTVGNYDLAMTATRNSLRNLEMTGVRRMLNWYRRRALSQKKYDQAITGLRFVLAEYPGHDKLVLPLQEGLASPN